MTKRQQIVDEIQAALKGITGWDIHSFFEWGNAFAPTDVPFVDVADIADNVTVDAGCATHELDVEISVVTNEPIDVLREHMSRVLGALAPIKGARQNGVSIEAVQTDESLLSAKIGIVVQYETERWGI